MLDNQNKQQQNSSSSSRRFNVVVTSVSKSSEWVGGEGTRQAALPLLLDVLSLFYPSLAGPVSRWCWEAFAPGVTACSNGEGASQCEAPAVTVQPRPKPPLDPIQPSIGRERQKKPWLSEPSCLLCKYLCAKLSHLKA